VDTDLALGHNRHLRMRQHGQLMTSMPTILRHLGRRPLCNGLAHRAPRGRLFVFPLCYRCCGLIIGALLGALIVREGSQRLSLAVLLAIPAFVDGVAQKISKIESTNFRRLLTGILLGLGLHYSQP
jgi:uncharacterized membrane protein